MDRQKWGGRPDLKLVRWRQSLLLRPAQATCAHYGLEKPTQGLCNQLRTLGPASPIQPHLKHHPPTPSLNLFCLNSHSQWNLVKYLHSIVLTLIQCQYQLNLERRKNISTTWFSFWLSSMKLIGISSNISNDIDIKINIENDVYRTDCPHERSFDFALIVLTRATTLSHIVPMRGPTNFSLATCNSQRCCN